MEALIHFADTKKKAKSKKEPEKKVEAYLKRRIVEFYSGVSYKFTSPSRRSVPDQICIIPFELIPTGFIFFVECKSTGEKPTYAQEEEHEKLRDLGCLVYVADSKDSVEQVLYDVGRHLLKLRAAACL